MGRSSTLEGGRAGRARRAVVVVILLLGTLAGLFPQARAARAADLLVTTAADDGDGSLRRAIADAASGDTITFAESLRGGAIILTSGQLTINKSLTITGLGAGDLAVRRSDEIDTALFRVFDVVAGTGADINPTVAITGLTIANGAATVAGVASTGGGVRITAGEVTLRGVVVTGNVAHNYAGVYANIGSGATSAHVTVQDSVIRGNSAVGTSTSIVGGLMVGFGATATVDRTTISGNSAQYYYGGVYVQGSDVEPISRATITNSTISGNNAYTGGGLSVRNKAEVTLANSTVSGNTTSYYSGLFVEAGASLTAESSTIADNTSSVVTYAAQGMQIHRGNDGLVTLRNSIVSGGGFLSYNCNQAMTDGGYNIEDGTTCTFTTGGSKQGTTANLGPLQDNGGPTFTRMPQPGSPAIDAGYFPACFSAVVDGLDQRGVARPQGPACDIGAVEYLAIDRPTLTAIAPTGATVGAGPVALTLTGTAFVPGSTV